ncbi:hypothetical protein [uncultured Thiothrix sp.]|uniref:hypothetical protein n=1 Tax=uncultured Thiothrix sp. TaxID=223185 RepID=UPI00262B1207|nr:hypothetical protein [uncultured Thiothrix sp.]
MLRGMTSARLTALFAFGCALLNFPLLALWDKDATVLGVPLFPAALFIIWAGMIAVLAWLMETDER